MKTTAIESEKSEIRFCKDIGCWTIDRSRLTCKHASPFCAANCFNRKLYPVYKDMVTKDVRNDQYWNGLTGAKLDKTLKAKRTTQTNRIRFMSRGEALSTATDFPKIIDICKANPNRLFWLPTRAWRKESFKRECENRLFKVKNLRILASIDPSNSQHEIDQLIADGWSTMFFGNDEVAPIENSFQCPKTWEHIKGACATCKRGCFSKKQSHVWLKQH